MNFENCVVSVCLVYGSFLFFCLLYAIIKRLFGTNMSGINSKFSFLARFLKMVVLVVISCAVVFGNFVLENKFANGNFAKSEGFTVFDYMNENVIPEDGVVRFYWGKNEAEDGVSSDDGEGFSEGGADFPHSVDVVSVKDHEYIFKLNSGRFWGNFSSSDAKVNILVGEKVVLIVDKAIFDIEFDGDNLKIFTYGGDVYIGFLDAGVKVDKYTGKYSPIFMNRFIVPCDSQAVVAISKIDQRLKGLLYSRLYTEFRRSSVSNDTRNSVFVKENFKQDQKYLEDLKKEFVSDERYQRRSVSEGTSSDFLFWVEKNLTFVPEKKKEMLFNHVFAYLDQAIFYANKDDPYKMQEFWNKFNEYRYSLLPATVSESDIYYNKINEYIGELDIFSPGEQQHDVYKNLLDQKFSEGKDLLGVTDTFWLSVYKAKAFSPGKVRSAMDDYYKYLDQIVDPNSSIKSSDPELYQVFVAYQDQLFENLFLRYSMFYQDVYFAIKDVLENELLSLYGQGQLRTELAQDFISRKIDFLRKLMSLFFEDEMNVQVAKNITSRLIEEINDLMPPESAKVAVIALFESQLNNLGDFWGYLSNVEYNSSKAYGLTHKDRYEVYLKNRDKIWSFTNVTDAVLGGDGTISVESLNEVVDQVTDVFNKSGDVKNFEIGEVIDPTQRYVDVEFVIGGYPVSATFDRYDKTLKNIYAYDQLISSENVKLDDLLSLVDEKLADQYKIDSSGGSADLATNVKNNAQRIAGLYLMNKIKVAGFDVKENQIQLVDEDNFVYRVDNVALEDMSDVIVTFDYLSKAEKVTNLYFLFKGKPIVLVGEYTLKELHDIIVNNEVEAKGEVQKTQRGGI